MNIGDFVRVDFGNQVGLATIVEDKGFDFYCILFHGQVRMMHKDYLTVINKNKDKK